MRISNRGRSVRAAAAGLMAGAAVFATAPAMAGDLPGAAPYMISAPWESGWSFGLPRTKWTGFYLGAFASGSHLETSISPNPYAVGNFPTSRSDSPGGGLWGGWLDRWGRTAIGYGVDAAIQYNGATRTMSGERIRDQADFDLRGRLGFFALNNALFLYGLAGGSAGLFDRSWEAAFAPALAPFPIPGTGRQRNSLNFGFEAGAGAEMQIFDRVTLRGEYTWRETPSIHHLQAHQVKVGLAYHF